MNRSPCVAWLRSAQSTSTARPFQQAVSTIIRFAGAKNEIYSLCIIIVLAVGHPSDSSIRTMTSRSVMRLLAMSMRPGNLGFIYPSESIIPCTKPRITSIGKRKSSYNSLSCLRCLKYRPKSMWAGLTSKSCTLYPSLRPFKVDLLKFVRTFVDIVAGLPVRTSHWLANRSANACEVTERRIKYVPVRLTDCVPSLRTWDWRFDTLLTQPSPNTTPITYPKAYCFSGTSPNSSASTITCSMGFSGRRFLRLGLSMRLRVSHFLQRGPLKLRCFLTPQSIQICDCLMQTAQYFCFGRRGLRVNVLPQRTHAGRIFMIGLSPYPAPVVISSAEHLHVLPLHYTTNPPQKLVYTVFSKGIPCSE